MNLNEALEFALAGRAVLFTGAGFSLGATNVRDGSFKSGRIFGEHLAKIAKLPAETVLEDVAEWFASHIGEAALIKELLEEFTAKEVNQNHMDVLKLPWRQIYTTNYDDVMEKAASKIKKRLTSKTISDECSPVIDGGTLCVHLNGFISRVNSSTIKSEIKLTDTSYLTDSVKDSPWAVRLRQDMEAAQAVFFLGYSTADIDIRRLLYESPALKEKCFFILGPQVPLTHEKISRFGTVTTLDLNSFVQELNKAAAVYSTDTEPSPIGYCVKQFVPSTTPASFEDRFMFDLLLYGDVKSEYVWQSLHSGLKYFVDIQAASDTLSSLQNDFRAVVLYSDLGNGKSATLEVLKVKASLAGYDVYSILNNADTLLEELQYVFKSPRKTLLILEHFADWPNALEFINNNAPATCVFVFTARTSTYDLLADKIATRMKNFKIAEISLNRLQPNESEQVVDIFDHYGLWGPIASKNKAIKLDYINKTCGGQWSAILIDLFNAPQVRDRLKPLIEAIGKKKPFYDVLIAIMVLNILEVSPTINRLLTLCGTSVLDKAFKDDSSVREVLNVTSGEIRLRSSLAGKHILKNFADPNALISVLVKMAKASDINSKTDRTYRELLTNLTRFRNIQLVFPDNEASKAIFKYYENIKGLENNKHNPLFWLQYAISCTVFEDFPRAQKYFDTAYSYANSRLGYSPHQIDNHYARFLLQRSIKIEDNLNCMNSYRDAIKLIIEQTRTESLHFPFRVATLIGEFYNKFSSVLKPSEILEISRAAKLISDRIQLLDKDVQKQRYISICLKEMQRILQLALPH